MSDDNDPPLAQPLSADSDPIAPLPYEAARDRVRRSVPQSTGCLPLLVALICFLWSGAAIVVAGLWAMYKRSATTTAFEMFVLLGVLIIAGVMAIAKRRWNAVLRACIIGIAIGGGVMCLLEGSCFAIFSR